MGETIFGIDPLVLIGIVLVIGIVLAVLAFVYYRKSFAKAGSYPNTYKTTAKASAFSILEGISGFEGRLAFMKPLTV